MPNLYDTIGIIKNGEKTKLPIVMVSPQVDEPDYVEVVADGVKTYSALLDELFALVDFDKVNQKSCVVIHSQYGDEFQFVASYSTSGIYTGNSNVNTNGINNGGLCILASGSTYYLYRNGSNSNASSLKLNNGGYIRLYYNSTYTLDLTTKAENCLYGNSNVQSALDKIVNAPPSPVYSVTEGDTVVTFSGSTNTAYDMSITTAGWYEVYLDGKSDLRFEGNLTGFSNGGVLGMCHLVYLPVGTFRVRYYGSGNTSGCAIKAVTIS